MTSKKEWVLKAFKGQPVEQVPVGFWHHFTSETEWTEGLNNPEIYQKNLAGHRQFLKEIEPDFIKLMSDGFFRYPNEALTAGVTDFERLKEIEPLPDDHPWFSQQIQLIQEIKAGFSEDIVALYNIFAPATYLKWNLAGQAVQGDSLLADFLKEAPAVLKYVLEIIAQDLAKLTTKVIEVAQADGIYLSVQNIQDPRVSDTDYLNIIKPSEYRVLQAANQAGGINILHICGYEGAANHLNLYQDYPAQVFNWAVASERISLSEGRQLFGGKTVLGGFNNTKEGVLYTGDKAAVQAAVRELLKQAGRQATIIGADCTVPADIDPKRIWWVKEAAGAAK
ncbi:uroporphyrinogen decarboxylase [Streptococcus chenjunshii]|uniref:Uroporphyrinogen decarboxylase n=1 Tax=Streptococcus chenjunshii TaxID=2173853 RepID=A0A372KN20_9STRE|nr:uroporphyrinogen decarboxylase family protein [Streptococcus chenjunshii]AXQ78819.1 uroporphyrinogen decarboxylase [Streptococcus chenjunshii]RFU51580.1 uroporphyrinogen decarboxylase [Streptococcus chenjunshii]RFU53700.1 uroporphyrinogen decarboxylase [Streptococcus chenjunshii]